MSGSRLFPQCYTLLMARQSTPLATQILELLTKEHVLTAPQLLTKLEKHHLQYNKTSLYRALEKLLSNQKICRQSFGGTEVYYELEGHSHDHFVCSACSRVFPIDSQLQKNISIAGHQIDHTHVTVFGRCQNCVQAHS